MSRGKPGKVIDLSRHGDIADTRRHEKREAKARDIRQRFAAARSASGSKSKAADRLKKLFKNPGRNPSRKP